MPGKCCAGGVHPNGPKLSHFPVVELDKVKKIVMVRFYIIGIVVQPRIQHDDRLLVDHSNLVQRVDQLGHFRQVIRPCLTKSAKRLFQLKAGDCNRFIDLFPRGTAVTYVAFVLLIFSKKIAAVT